MAARLKPPMIYLTGVSSATIRELHHPALGLLCQPGNIHRQIPHYPCWAADNACFAQGQAFNLDAFLQWLDQLPRAGCLFAVAPDVVGDATATLIRAAPALPRIRQMGFPVAFVAQDGVEHLSIPWNGFDALFIGGTTSWKLSPMAVILVREAKARGKWVHCGRVNSARRLWTTYQMGCDSVDGTYLAFAPQKNLPHLLTWLDALPSTTEYSPVSSSPHAVLAARSEARSRVAQPAERRAQPLT